MKIVKISITPGTQDNRVVCRTLNPNEAMMSDCWFVNELGTLFRAEKRAKSHVLGSVRASIILEMLTCGMKSMKDHNGIEYILFHLEVFVFHPRLVFLR